MVATVNERSSHTIPTPHGGGIAIVSVWFLGLIYLYFFNEVDSPLFFALIIGIVIAVVGLIDDILDLKPKTRMIVFIFIGIGGLFIIGGLNSISFGVFSITNPIITNIFGILLILWYINLTNFIDGINGYVGSEFVFLSITGLIFFGGEHFIVLGVAVLGFLFWNWNKAKIFMGDVGSTLLGYNIAIFTLYYSNQDASNLWIWIILFSVFWFDATVTLIRRKLNGEKLSIAHKKHAYQRLTQAGWSHRKVTLCSIGLNILIFFIVYFISNIMISSLLSLILLSGAYLFVESKKKFE
jgi:Fuc2NAc and GlcNAc transferase